MGLLQTASFRGVPLKVIAAQVKKGRRLAIHEYPFRDGGWAEDMGRAPRTYSFSGYLIGDLAPAMQLLLDNAVEAAGPGLLIHPTIGAVKVALVSSATSVHRDKMRVVEVALEFIEQGGTASPTAIVATAIAALAAADSALIAAWTDLGGVAIPTAALEPVVPSEGPPSSPASPPRPRSVGPTRRRSSAWRRGFRRRTPTRRMAGMGRDRRR